MVRNSHKNFVAPGCVVCSSATVTSTTSVVPFLLLSLFYVWKCFHSCLENVWNIFTLLQIKSCDGFLHFQSENTNWRLTRSFSFFPGYLSLMFLSVGAFYRREMIMKNSRFQYINSSWLSVKFILVV